MSNSTPPQPGSAPGPDKKATKADTAGRTTPAAGRDALRSSRTGGFYVGVIALGVLLILLIIFVAQNTDATTIRFLAWEAELPLAVSLLIAAVTGIFMAGIAAGLRILQLRRRVKHERKAAP